MISYAQNFEDVMLWRALGHIDRGFYIDVGAAWPDKDSVTRAFYERGWRGINIEPNIKLHQQLINHRSGDTNLCVALGEREDRLTMNIFGDTGLSTLSNSVAEMHQQAGLDFEPVVVSVSTLAALWKMHVPESQHVHFLKVDVEGFEGEVLRGNDWSENRPWIVLVEAMSPGSKKENHDGWEPILLNSGYLFAYADGLNRFYIAAEKQKLLGAFAYPPNAFDRFVTITQREYERKLASAEAFAIRAQVRGRLAELKGAQNEQVARDALAKTAQNEQVARDALAKAVASKAEITKRLQKSEARVAALTASTSWRITAPLRWVGEMVRTLMTRTPWMPRLVLPTSEEHPPDTFAKASIALRPRARVIYSDLKDAVSKVGARLPSEHTMTE